MGSVGMAVIRAVLILLWLLSPAFFLFLYLRGLRSAMSIRGRRIRIWLAVSSVAINWILFVALLIRSQTPYGMIFQTSLLTDFLLGLSCFGVVLGIRKWPLAMANVALITLWVAIAYAPAHWLGHWRAQCTVRVNGQQVSATLFLGNPYDSEAEEIALVDIPGVGDYFLSFGAEKVRLASEKELVHLPGGIWDFKSLRQMSFVEPLPSTELNQFRIAAPDGRVIDVQF